MGAKNLPCGARAPDPACGRRFFRDNIQPVIASYRAYGLTLKSEISIPGLLPCSPNAAQFDISLELAGAPQWVRDASELPSLVHRREPGTPETADPAFELTSFGNAVAFQLAYTDGTRFFVDGAASRIWGRCEPPLTIEDLSTYLLGPVMGFVLRLRGVTSLHASTICVEGHAIALSGAAEAGKSTTAAAMAMRGAPVMCEDISPLHEEGGRFVVEAGYPRVCLWPDAVEKLFGSADALPRLTPNWEKRYIQLDGARAKFEPHRKPLGAVYLFAHRVNDATAPRIKEAGAREALLELVQNTYMNSLLSREQRTEEFDVLSRLVRNV